MYWKLIINGINQKQIITVFQECDPDNIKWDDVGAEYFMESTGIFNTKEKAGAHLKGRAKRFFISKTSEHSPMIMMDLNP